VREPRYVGIAAQRAGDELPPVLAFEVLARGKPTLEAMAVLATQLKNNHDDSLTPSGGPDRM
jgi:hypothetical protein